MVNGENSGYMAPEYAMDGLFFHEIGFFSFGVMMLEIISEKNESLSKPYRTSK